MLNVFDIVGPIMIGPSSSHTAGAVRIGKYARLVLGDMPVKATINLSGSFAKTYKGHGTDRAIIAGILGMDTDDSRIPESLVIAKNEGLAYTFTPCEIEGAHPNTAEIILEACNGDSITLEGSSVGGGNILIKKINGTKVSIDGKSDTILITHSDTPGMVGVVSNLLGSFDININGFSLCRDRKGGKAIMTIAIDGHMNDDIKEQILKEEHIYNATLLKAL